MNSNSAAPPSGAMDNANLVSMMTNPAMLDILANQIVTYLGKNPEESTYLKGCMKIILKAMAKSYSFYNFLVHGWGRIILVSAVLILIAFYLA